MAHLPAAGHLLMKGWITAAMLHCRRCKPERDLRTGERGLKGKGRWKSHNDTVDVMDRSDHTIQMEHFIYKVAFEKFRSSFYHFVFCQYLCLLDVKLQYQKIMNFIKCYLYFSL